MNNAWFRTAELKQVRLVKYGVPSSLKSRSEAHHATRQDKREGLDLISITFRSTLRLLTQTTGPTGGHPTDPTEPTDMYYPNNHRLKLAPL